MMNGTSCRSQTWLCWKPVRSVIHLTVSVGLAGHLPMKGRDLPVSGPQWSMTFDGGWPGMSTGDRATESRGYSPERGSGDIGNSMMNLPSLEERVPSTWLEES